MNVQQLMAVVDLSETHRRIVGDYDRGYALGVTDNPPAFLLRVEPQDIRRFPTHVTVGGARVPVVVHGGFRVPMPQ